MTESHVHPEGTAPARGAEEPPLGPLVATDVCYRRAGRTLLDHVSLLAPPGQVIAVTGPPNSVAP